MRLLRLAATVALLNAFYFCPATGAEHQPDEIKKLLETGSGQDLDRVFTPIEYSDRNCPQCPPPPDVAIYAWQADILRKRLGEASPEVRATVLRILSALDHGTAVQWALAHMDDAKGMELIACVHVLLDVHTGTDTTDNQYLLGGFKIDEKNRAAVLTRISKPDFPLENISSWGLRKLLDSPKLPDALSTKVKEAIRRRALQVPEGGKWGIMEREKAVYQLKVGDPADLETLKAVAASGNVSPLRVAALNRLRDYLNDMNWGAIPDKVKTTAKESWRYVADADAAVRSAAFRVMLVSSTMEERFEWYSAHLAMKGKEGAGVVVECLTANSEIRDALRTPSRYPSILKLTPEQVSWLEEAGLNKARAQSWRKILEENKGARVPERGAPPATPPTMSPAEGETGPGEPTTGRAEEDSESPASRLGAVVVLLVALAVTGVVAFLIVRARRTRPSGVPAQPTVPGSGVPDRGKNDAAGGQEGGVGG